MNLVITAERRIVEQPMLKKCFRLMVLAIVLSSAISPASASTPSEDCEASKLGTTAKYSMCRLRADAKAARDGSAPDYTKCSLGKFILAEAEAGVGVCPTEDDLVEIADFIDACTSSVAVALDGGQLLPDVLTCNEDLALCDETLATKSAALALCGTNLTATNADLGTCNSNLSATNADLGVCHDNLSSTNADLGSCRQEAEGLASDLGVCNAALSATNADLGVCNGDLSSTNADLGACRQGAAGLTNDLGDCNADLSATNADLGACGEALSTTNVDLGTCIGDRDSCQRDLAFYSQDPVPCLSGTVTRTGQTTCYDALGAVTTCTGSGQDGQYRKGVAAGFTDNGNGTITDNVSGLVWEKLSDSEDIHDVDNLYTWAESLSIKIASLNSGNFAGHNDWRLPNVKELETLKNFGVVSHATYPEFDDACESGCSATTCSCTGGYYWSSTSYTNGPWSAWGVHFFAGTTNVGTKTLRGGVRAVRGGF